MNGKFCIHIEKDYLGFCAAHFITYDGHLCEALHGHNFAVRLNLEGPLDENYYVLDFIRTKKMLKSVCDELDHRVLLPTESKLVKVEQQEDSIGATYGQRRYLFPREDVVLLPIPNVTSEMLAYHICTRMKETLHQAGVTHLSFIEVEVKESLVQGAIYREEF
ncbi:MAG TPA: 6-carboxytetrahydropterin synthase [Anaerolineae bacterium]|nr:6-carboxytetrahydropterin synthase [Anaerolineae bacterium]